MGFFDSLKKLDFSKIGDVVGKVATQAGNFVSAYGSGQGGTASKLLSGFGSLDIGEIFEVAGQVKNQVDNVRKTVQKIDVPETAMQVMAQQGFVPPSTTKVTEKQSTGIALGALKQTTDLILEETGENLIKLDALQKQLTNAQYKLNEYFDKQDQIGQGRMLQMTAPLIDNIEALNKEIEVVTNKIIKQENSHERAINIMSNAVNSLSNSPSMRDGVRTYENRFQTDYRGLPRRNIQYVPMSGQMPQMSINYAERMVPRTYTGLDYRQYENMRTGMNRVVPKYKPIQKNWRSYEESDDYDDDYDDEDSEEEYDY